MTASTSLLGLFPSQKDRQRDNTTYYPWFSTNGGRGFYRFDLTPSSPRPKSTRRSGFVSRLLKTGARRKACACATTTLKQDFRCVLSLYVIRSSHDWIVFPIKNTEQAAAGRTYRAPIPQGAAYTMKTGASDCGRQRCAGVTLARARAAPTAENSRIRTAIGISRSSWQLYSRRRLKSRHVGIMLWTVALCCWCLAPPGVVLVNAGWIDPDTKEEDKTMLSLEDGREFVLVGALGLCVGSVYMRLSVSACVLCILVVDSLCTRSPLLSPKSKDSQHARGVLYVVLYVSVHDEDLVFCRIEGQFSPIDIHILVFRGKKTTLLVKGTS